MSIPLLMKDVLLMPSFKYDTSFPLSSFFVCFFFFNKLILHVSGVTRKTIRNEENALDKTY